MKRLIILLHLINITTLTILSQTESTHYLLPDFADGTVIMKNGTKNQALLNYNMVTEEMVFYQGEQILALADPTLINLDTVVIGDRKFILNDKNNFVELIHNNVYKLYVEHNCRVLPPGKPAGYGGTSQTSSVDTYSSIQSGGMWYKLEVPDNFEIKPFKTYWIDDGSGSKEIRSMRQLRRFFSKNRESYNSYMKDNKVEFDDYESVKGLVDFIEMNSN